MAVRSFKVFLDTPSDTPQQKDTSPTSPTLSPSASISLTASLSSILSPVTATDKENLDPVTGEPVHPTNTNVKKRKTSVVLSTKTLAPLEPVLKDAKESAEGQPETKKRKASVSSGTKLKVKKDSKVLGSGKKATTKKLLRKPLTMPKVVEEVDVEREQALADSRCRDLTVSPLADVSEAYIESTIFGEALVEKIVPEDTRWLSKESSCEPEIRDYLTTAHLSASTSSSSTLRGSSPACEPPKVFSTPERKRIYSAFTFQSPSPASARLHKSPNDAITLGPLNFGEFDDASS
ncbi:hypothetical protein PQX77_008861 [Marasmius sp. AFHP31]|nr:hypothetical protein PQX77_008861 [Marasmius sp. AFHP31]